MVQLAFEGGRRRTLVELRKMFGQNGRAWLESLKREAHVAELEQETQRQTHSEYRMPGVATAQLQG